MKFGTLEFAPALEHPELLAPAVFGTLESLTARFNLAEIGVAAIDPALSDTAAFCEKYQIGMEAAANCVILAASARGPSPLRQSSSEASEPKEGKSRAEENIKVGPLYAACVILATTRADVNGLAKKTLDVKKVSFAPMEKAVAESQMEFGAITPVGLPDSWPILVDQAVANSERVIIGSGIRGSKLLVPGSFFAMLPGVHVLDGLGQIKHTD